MKYVIGIDLGTSATKTVLFTQEGEKISSASAEYSMTQPKNGWAEQDPEDWYLAAVSTLKEVIDKSCVSPSDIVSLGISGQMHGLVMLDEKCHVLRPCILWCDQRTNMECKELTKAIGREKLIEITANPAMTGFTASKILWVKKNESEIFEKCRHILLPKDYLRFRLTGDFATEMSDASGMQLLDVPNRKWSAEMAKAVGIPMEYLPKLYESQEVTGVISSHASKFTGLSTETLVVGGAGDNAATAVGTGVVRCGKSFTTIGTSGVVYAHTDKPIIDPKGRVHTFCCAVPNCWHVMGVTQGAGLSLQWFKNEFCAEEMALAEKSGEDVYSIMDREAQDISIGAERLLYLPYLMGERTPHLDANCRGVFFGISAMHTRAHLLRAVMEGVSYSLYDCLLIMEEIGACAETMIVTGGGGKSQLWRQILCDTFSMPVQTNTFSQGASLGAAVLAAVGAGIYKDISEACNLMVQTTEAVQLPLEEHTVEYRKYHKLYTELYQSLRQNYQTLAKL